MSPLKRKRRICYWDSDKRFTDAQKINLEKRLDFLPEFDFVKLRTLDSPELTPCDLVIVAAEGIEETIFVDWLTGLNKRMIRQNSIWTPALIATDINVPKLSSLLHKIADNNWYFDILEYEHIDSLPIRIANLLKIHDHLHELWRYQAELDGLQAKVLEMEKRFEQLKKTEGSA